jgi:lipoprotein-anchoring transpeptidase ErfK/SrfK
MSPKSTLRSALLAGLVLAAPQARAQLFWFAQPDPQQQPQRKLTQQQLQQQQQLQRQAQQQQAQPQPQHVSQQPQPRQDQQWWWGQPQPAAPQAPRPDVARQRLPDSDNGAVVDLASRNSLLDGDARRPGAASAAVLPPDADPNYSTPINYDPDVNYKFKTQKEVTDPTGQAAGTITINTAKRKLYLSVGDGKAIEYGIAVGKAGFAWKGDAVVGRKSYWPGWTPPPEMLERRPELPEHMDGSLANPLGARALYLFQDNKDTLFRIHGTNEPQSIGKAVSSGCIRMQNADVIDLYGRVTKGAHVVVM